MGDMSLSSFTVPDVISLPSCTHLSFGLQFFFVHTMYRVNYPTQIIKNMPRKFKGKRRFKRTSRKSRRGNSRTAIASTLFRGPSFIPDKVINKHRFVSQTVMSFSAAAEFNLEALGNSVFNPMPSIGHPAMGFNEMILLYQNYNVLSCRCNITVSNVSQEPVMVTLIPHRENPFPTGFTAADLQANPYAKYFVCAPAGDGKATRSMTSFMASRKMFGQEWYQSQNHFGTTTSSPAIIWRWAIHASYPVNVTTSLHITVDLTYYCQWIRRQLIDQSV